MDDDRTETDTEEFTAIEEFDDIDIEEAESEEEMEVAIVQALSDLSMRATQHGAHPMFVATVMHDYAEESKLVYVEQAATMEE